MRDFKRVILCGALTALSVYSQGFGGGLNIFSRPDFAYLTRKLPPIIQKLPGSTLKLNASASASVPKEVVDILITRTKAEILKDRARGIRFEDVAEIELSCKITAWELVSQDRQVSNGKSVETFRNIIGNVQATVTIINTGTHVTLDSENLKHRYEEEFNVSTGSSTDWRRMLSKDKHATRIPTPVEQQTLLMEGLAKKIAQRVVPIEEEVAIALPKGGKFSEIRKAAETKHWGDVAELAEKLEPFQKPDEDAYRHYVIGIAHEVLAYTRAEQPKVIEDELSRAQASYSKAKDMNSKEKKFSDPTLRVQDSLDHVNAMVAILSYDPKKDKKPETPKLPNNAFLIYLHRDLQRTDKFVINQIETVKDPQFDASPEGQDTLFKAGLSEDVVMAVSRRMAEVEKANRPAPPPPPAPVVAAPPAPAAPPAVVPAKPATPATKPAVTTQRPPQKKVAPTTTTAPVPQNSVAPAKKPAA